jgi:hypothetical protein
MNPNTQIRQKTTGKFRVGDRVRTLHWFPELVCEITEDRGNIGLRGRRLYGVKVRIDDWNEMSSELPEEDLRLADDKPSNGKT